MLWLYDQSGVWGRESFEDQVSADVGDIIQISETDLTTRGKAIDLFKVAIRIGTQREATEREELAGEKGILESSVAVDDRMSHRTFADDTAELSMKAPMSVSKPADLG